MKKLAAWALYWTGHAISKIQEMQPDGGRWFDFWFEHYVRCMQLSHRLNPDAWQPVSREHTEEK